MTIIYRSITDAWSVMGFIAFGCGEYSGELETANKKRERNFFLTPCFYYWRPHGESNPGYRRERPVS